MVLVGDERGGGALGRGEVALWGDDGMRLRTWKRGRFANLLCTALPAVLAHSAIITIPAMIMSIIGGLLIYGTIVTFGMFFQEEQEF